MAKKSTNNDETTVEVLNVVNQKPDVVVSVENNKYHSPLPSPQDMKEYEKIMPGAAKKAMKIAERKSKNETITIFIDFLTEILKLIAFSLPMILPFLGVAGSTYFINSPPSWNVILTSLLSFPILLGIAIIIYVWKK